MNILIPLVIVLPGLLILYFLFIYSRVINNFDKRVDATNDVQDVNLKYSQHYFLTRDKVKLYGWFFRAERSKGIIILVHGFSSKGKASYINNVKFFLKLNYDVFLFDLRSYGKSEGFGISLGINEWKDVEAAYDYVQHKLNKSDLKIGFYGNSMGAASVLIAAGKTNKGDFLITTVPFAKIQNLITPALGKRKYVPLSRFFLNKALRLRFGKDYNEVSALKFINKIEAPLLIIGAKKDEKVLPEDAKLLFDSATTKSKEFYMIDSNHNIYAHNTDEVGQLVENFLTKIVS